MSPKSRGRTPKGGHGRRRPAAPPPVSLAAAVLRAAAQLADDTDPLAAALAASAWLGAAWRLDEPGATDEQDDFVADLLDTVARRPMPAGAAAVAALARVAPDRHADTLTQALEPLRRADLLPSWAQAPPPVVERAWRAVNVWGSEIVLFLAIPASDLELTALLDPLGGTRVQSLLVTGPGAGENWPSLRPDDAEPATTVEVPVEDAFRELRAALALSELTWPRPEDEGLADLQAFAWALAGPGAESDLDDRSLMTDADRDAVLDGFAPCASGAPVDDPAVVRRSLAGELLDFGDHLLPAYDCWSPEAVEVLLLDHLPRSIALTDAEVAALPGVLHEWLDRCLAGRGVPDEWVRPVHDAVDACAEDFAEAMADARDAFEEHLADVLDEVDGAAPRGDRRPG